VSGSERQHKKNRHTCIAAWKPVRGKHWAAERDVADQKENI
jgi:hypothetical protein